MSSSDSGSSGAQAPPEAGPSSKPYDGSQLLPLEKRVEEPYLIPQEMGGGCSYNRQDYFVLDRPEQAAWLTCHDASRIALVDNTGGLALYAHRHRPTVFARLVGRVIGIEEKEKRIIWLVDDGSAVIAVHHYMQPDEEVVESRNSDEEAGLSIAKGKGKGKGKGKAKVAECGIPPEYVRPEPLRATRRPPKPGDARRAMEEGWSRARGLLSCIDVGVLVQVIGRIRIGPGRERIVMVEKALIKGLVQKHWYGRTQGTIEILKDPNDEPRHMLRALYLSATDYSKRPSALTLESNQAEDTRMPMGDSRTRNRSYEEVEGPKKQWVLPKEEIVAQHLSRKRLGMPKSDNPIAASAPFTAPRPAGNDKILRCTTPVEADTNGDIPSPSSSGPPIPSSSQTTGTPRHRRKLRSFTKLPDAMLTDALFRVYAQKHIVDFCSGDDDDGVDGDSKDAKGTEVITISDDEGERTPRATFSKRLPRDPPAFTMAYLSRVTDLRGFAFRLVRLIIEKRERKEAREARRRAAKSSLSSSSARIVKRSYVGREKEKQKVEQLFAWAIRAMVADGVIVVARRGSLIWAPLNGEKPRRTADKFRFGQLNWSEDEDSDSSSLESESSSGSPTPRKKAASHQTRRGHSRRTTSADEVEAYQLVTPRLLAEPLSSLQQRISTTDIDLLTSLLRSSDERWRRISETSVEDALPFALQYRHHCHHRAI